MVDLGIYINHKQMTEDMMDYVKVVPKVIPKIDIVVAIPRGGFFPASIISSILGKPMTTPDRILEAKCYWTSSNRVKNSRTYESHEYTVSFDKLLLNEPVNILLVDDISYNQVGTLERVKQLILTKFPHANVFKTSIYCMERTKKTLDFYVKQIDMDHWMQKDLLIRRRSQITGFDIDGVLCLDPIWQNGMSDEEWSLQLVNAIPYLIPAYQVEYLITARREKYRAITEKWLKDNGVRYKELIMYKGEGICPDHAAYKTKLCNSLLPEGIYFESSHSVAMGMHEMGCTSQIICTDSDELIGAANIGYEYHPAFEGIRRNKPHPVIVKPVIEEQIKSKPNWLFKK